MKGVILINDVEPEGVMLSIIKLYPIPIIKTIEKSGKEKRRERRKKIKTKK